MVSLAKAKVGDALKLPSRDAHCGFKSGMCTLGMAELVHFIACMSANLDNYEWVYRAYSTSGTRPFAVFPGTEISLVALSTSDLPAHFIEFETISLP